MIIDHLARVRPWLGWLLHPGSRLSQRVAHAALWAFVTRIAEKALTIIKMIILARMLAPADFGVMGIGLLMISVLDSFTQTGFRNALIQRQGDIRPYLDTAWTMQLIRGLALAGLLVWAAPFIASFFNVPDADNVIRVIAIVLVINGLKNIGIVYFEKEMEFQKRFLLQLAQTAPQVAVGIVLAFALQNVWALVYSVLAGGIAQAVASYLLHPYRPRLRLDWAKAMQMYRFGRWIFLGSILFFLARSDGMVVGKLLGPAALGIYQMAQRFAELSTRELPQVAHTVAFPAYSKLQMNQVALGKAFFMGIGTIASVVFPLTVAIFLLADPLVNLILGEQWVAVAAVLPPLAAAGAIRSVAAMGGSLFNGVGRPDLDFKQSLLRTAAIFALIYPLVRFAGVAGAGYTVLAGAVLMLPFLLWFVRKILGVSIWQFIGAVFPSIILSAIVGGSIAAAYTVVEGLGPSGIVVALVCGGLAYAAVSFLMWKTASIGPIAALKMLK